MSMQVQDAGARWHTYLTEMQEESITILCHGGTERLALEVDFRELQAWDPDFALGVLEHPKEIIREAEKTLARLCRDLGHAIDPVLLLHDLPPDVRRDLREIGSEDIHKLRVAEVVVTRVSDLKPRIYDADFRCVLCGATMDVRQESEQEMVEPAICDTEKGGCGAYPGGGKGSTRFELVIESTRMINNQFLEIQELPEEVKGSAQPARATVLVEGEMCNDYLPGERITANLLPYVHSEYKRNRRTPMFQIVHRLHSAKAESTPFTEIHISDEDKEVIRDIASEPDLLTLLQHSIAPSIYGSGKLNFVKRSLALQLFGGVARRNPDGTRLRGDIHLLLMGDPGIAKSQLLTYMSKISPRAKYASGGGISAAGLTAAAIKDAFGDGRFTLEAGVLPLADMGIACIDEIDKISSSDRGSLHEAMEQQVVSVAKGGITTQLRARCSVLAAANPEGGRFSKRGPNQSLMHSFKETGLPLPLASRFDIIWMMRDEVDAQKDTSIARHILENRARGTVEARIDQGTAFDPKQEEEDQIWAKGVNDSRHLTAGFLRKYVAYAKRSCHPDLTKEAQTNLIEYYAAERNRAESEDDGFEDTQVIPMTPRQFEALTRLTEAHARMHLRQEATAEDAHCAIAIFRHWREEENIKDEAEMHSGVSVSTRNARSRVQIHVRDLQREVGEAELNEIYNRCHRESITEDQVDDAIQLLLRNGIIFEPRTEAYVVT